MPPFMDLTGKKLRNWLIIERLPNDRTEVVWLCRCDCGNIRNVRSCGLLNGTSNSCKNCKLHYRKRKHGLSKHGLYAIWRGIKRRCLVKTDEGYKNYGGRGIKICNEWLNKDIGFQNFYNWAIENGWEKGLTIERIDVNGNYCPENCKWVPRKEQTYNKRSSNIVEYEGKLINITHLVERYGHVSLNSVLYRLSKGWKLEDALFSPPRPGNRSNHPTKK